MPFKKGDPRINRNGRPQGTKNYETLRKEAIKELAKINKKTVQEIEIMLHTKGIGEALKGNFQFYKDDMDRTYGQAKQPIEHSVEITGARELANKLQDILKDEDNGETKESDKVVDSNILQGEGQETIPDNGQPN